MATDLTTGETGNAWELLAKAIERQQKRWAAHLAAGRQRVFQWKASDRRRRTRMSPTRFYKLMHDWK